MHFEGGRDIDQGLQQGNDFHQATWVSGLVPGHQLIGAKVLYQIFMAAQAFVQDTLVHHGFGKVSCPTFGHPLVKESIPFAKAAPTFCQG